MSRLPRLLFPFAALLVTTLSAASPARAAYPERTITVICASGAGGAVDLITRIVTDQMARTLGQNVVIQNEPGAGGTISITNVSKAPPDGYTVLSIGPSVATIKDLYPKSTIDVQQDIQPITMIGQIPLVLVVHKDVPAKNYADLITYMKAHPGELTFASNGRGSGGHLAGSLFKKLANVNVRYIPYRSTPQATADLLGGRVSMIWLSSLGNLAGTDAVRPIAVSLKGQRWNKFPDTPTFDEAGLKGYEATTWVSLYVPKGTPKEVADKLGAAAKAALDDPGVQSRFNKAGIVPPSGIGAAFLEKYLRDDIEKWGDILRNTKDE